MKYFRGSPFVSTLAVFFLVIASFVVGLTPVSITALSASAAPGTGLFELVATSQTTLYAINPTSKVVTMDFTTPSGDVISGMAVGSTGIAWVVYAASTCSTGTSCPGSAVSVDLSTGVTGTPVAAGTGPASAALSPDGSTLYVLDCGTANYCPDGEAHEVTPINTATGTSSTPIPVTADGCPVFGGTQNNAQTSPDGADLLVGGEGDGTAVDLSNGTAQMLTPQGGPFAQDFLTCPLVLNANATEAYGFIDEPSPSVDYGIDTLDIATGADSTTPVATSLLDTVSINGEESQGAGAYSALSPDGGTLLVDGAIGEATSDVSDESVGFQSVGLNSKAVVSSLVTVLGAGWEASGLVVSPDGLTAYVSADNARDASGTVESEIVPITLSNDSVGVPFGSVTSGSLDTKWNTFVPVVLPEASTGASTCTASPNVDNAAGFTWATASATSANQADVNYTLSACSDTPGDTYTWSVPGYSDFVDVGPLNVGLPDGNNQVTLTVTDSNGAVVAQLSQTINVVPVPSVVIVPNSEVPSPTSPLDVRYTLDDCDTQGATSYVVSVDDGTVGSTATSCDDEFTVDVPAGAHTVQLSTSDAEGDEVTTSVTLDAMPIPALEVNETALVSGATLDAVVLNACGSAGGTKFYFSVNDPTGDTVIGGNIGDDSVCSDTFDVTPNATYDFSVQVTDATGSTSEFQSSISQSYDVNPPPAPGNNGCTWNPLSAESCIYNIEDTVADVLLGGTPRPPDFIVASGSVADVFEGDAGVEVTCDGSVFESIGAGIGTPGISAVVGLGWVGSPYGPEPSNGEIDSFLSGLSENVQGGFVGGLELEAEGGQIAYVTSLGYQAGASVTITDGLLQGKVSNAPTTPTDFCEPAWLESEVGLLTPAGLPSSLPTSAASLQITVGDPPPTVTGNEIVAISGVGAEPDSVVIAGIGDPAYFGRAVADANGDFTIVGTIDPSLAPGPNTLYIEGTSPDGQPLALSTPITVASGVSGGPVFTADSPDLTGIVGSNYAYTFVATGNPTPTYAFAGTEPTWLKINATSGTVSGVPPAGTTSFTYSVVATNGVTPNATSGPFTVVVSAVSVAPAFTADSPDLTGTVGSNYAYTFVASGNPTPVITEFGLLPRGLRFTANANGTATIAGTLQIGSMGIYVFTLRAKNSAGSVFKTFVVWVKGVKRKRFGGPDFWFGRRLIKFR